MGMRESYEDLHSTQYIAMFRNVWNLMTFLLAQLLNEYITL
jgi:hypothetical protein